MSKGVLYSNGVVAGLSNTLLTKDFLSRLGDCATVDNVLEALAETNFAFSQEEITLEEKMQLEVNKLIDFVKNESPDESFTQFFLLFYDYENIQTFCKCLSLNLDPVNYIVSEGKFTFDQIKNNIITKNYNNFKNPYIKGALLQFDSMSANNKDLNGWEIETIFKKNLYANLLKISNNILTPLTKSLITIENISVASRAKTQFELESQIINYGLLSKKELIMIFNKDKSVLNLNLPSELKVFLRLALGEKTTENILNFEKQKQNFISNYFYKNKDRIETVCPFAYFCYSKLNDIKNIRLAFSFVKNGLNKEIKKRILISGK